jgi:hypothetical protein
MKVPDKKTWKQISDDTLTLAKSAPKESPQLAQGWYIVSALAQIAETLAPSASPARRAPAPDDEGTLTHFLNNAKKQPDAGNKS